MSQTAQSTERTFTPEQRLRHRYARPLGFAFRRSRLRQDLRAHRTVLVLFPARRPRVARARRSARAGGHHVHRARRARNARSRAAQMLRTSGQAPPEEAEYWLSLVRALDARGSARSTPFVRRCCAHTPWRPASIRASRCSSKRSPRRCCRKSSTTSCAGWWLGEIQSPSNWPPGSTCQPCATWFAGWSKETRPGWKPGLPSTRPSKWRGGKHSISEHVVPGIARRVAELPASRLIISLLQEYATRAARRCRFAATCCLPSCRRCRVSRERGRALAEELRVIREHAKVQGAGRADDWSNAEAYEAYRDAATKLREKIDKLEVPVSFDASAALEAARVGSQLLAIAAGVRGRLRRAQARAGRARFRRPALRALETCWSIPSRPSCGAAWHRIFDLLLVDEFQDTDPHAGRVGQGPLRRAPPATASCFSWATHKQSIYRFRGADPAVFRAVAQRDCPPPASSR